MLQQTFDILQFHPLLFLSMVALLGLVVGSFLNVAIYRIPIMIEQAYSRHLAQANNQPTPNAAPFDLVSPPSHCTHCKAPLAWWANIPVLSYLFLFGISRCCHETIPSRYPLIELLTATLGVFAAFHFGFHWQTAAAMVLCCGLITLLFIDVDHFLLPDDITLPLLWLGLLANQFSLFTSLENAVYGAILGYSVLWIVGWLFHLVRGIEGIGQGDYKLLALLGAWLGWQQVPFIILISSFVGACYGGIRLLLGKQKQHDPIPFGPFLAITGIVCLFWGPKLLHAYLLWHGMHHFTHINETFLC